MYRFITVKFGCSQRGITGTRIRGARGRCDPRPCRSSEVHTHLSVNRRSGSSTYRRNGRPGYGPYCPPLRSHLSTSNRFTGYSQSPTLSIPCPSSRRPVFLDPTLETERDFTFSSPVSECLSSPYTVQSVDTFWKQSTDPVPERLKVSIHRSDMNPYLKSELVDSHRSYTKEESRNVSR